MSTHCAQPLDSLRVRPYAVRRQVHRLVQDLKALLEHGHGLRHPLKGASRAPDHRGEHPTEVVTFQAIKELSAPT